MIIIAQYRGRSWISKLIQWQTRSKWSHSAAVLHDQSIIESWHKGGVSHVDKLFTNHKAGTPVDLYVIDCTEKQRDRFEEFLLMQAGKKYDFLMVFRFISRKRPSQNNKWFCSELVTAALNYAHIYPLCRVGPGEVSPQMLGMSPLLRRAPVDMVKDLL